jgi:flagellar protein FlaG
MMNISQINDFGASKAVLPNTTGSTPPPVSPKQINPAGASNEATKIKPTEPAMGEEAKLTPTEVVEIVQKANKALSDNASNLKFTVDKDSGARVVQLVDKETQEVLRQIPSVEMLKIAKAIEKMQGVLVSTQA